MVQLELVKKRQYHEMRAQIALVHWFNLQYPEYKGCLQCSLNDAVRSPRSVSKYAAMGAIWGQSDLFLAVPKNGFGGFYIEMKAPKKKPRENQTAFMDKMRSVGYKAEYFDDWIKAKEAIEEYLKNEQSEKIRTKAAT